MPGPERIEGYAIVSADGMIANAVGIQPDALRIESDQKFFHDGLAHSDAVAHGRNSYEGGHERRRRLILTRRIAGLERDRANPNVVFWNPQGSSLTQAWDILEPSGGRLAVIGGTDVFGHFLELGYHQFHLTRVTEARLPGGRPVFPGVPLRSPEELLASHGLSASAPRILDAKSGATLVTWQR